MISTYSRVMCIRDFESRLAAIFENALVPVETVSEEPKSLNWWDRKKMETRPADDPQIQSL
jgi:hypothetical protein